METGRVPKVFLLWGPKGSGKTSTARIIAYSLQCDHQKRFGVPCRECYDSRAWSIYEINCAEFTGKKEIQEKLSGTEYGVLGSGKYRVYILDECHKASDAALELMLKYLEDGPETTVFILCTTVPHELPETLRSRCVAYEFKELEEQDVTVLITRLLKVVKSDLPVDRLADVLLERGVRSPRLIAQAVEKYVATADPEQAGEVEGSAVTNTDALCKAVVKGDWDDVSRVLLGAQVSDINGVRFGLIQYLRRALLECSDISNRTKTLANAVTVLCNIGKADDAVMAAALAAELYRVTAMFASYKL
jgi:replication-associated recombination protein RarA